MFTNYSKTIEINFNASKMITKKYYVIFLSLNNNSLCAKILYSVTAIYPVKEITKNTLASTMVHYFSCYNYGQQFWEPSEAWSSIFNQVSSTQDSKTKVLSHNQYQYPSMFILLEIDNIERIISTISKVFIVYQQYW